MRRLFVGLAALMVSILGVGLPAATAGAATSGWTLMSGPPPLSGSTIEWASVSCVSSTFCMAVGPTKTLTPPIAVEPSEFWNGSTWSYVSMPVPSVPAQLTSVSCVTSSFCMAVGFTATAIFADEWNGSAWSLTSVAQPPAGDQVLVSVQTASARPTVRPSDRPFLLRPGRAVGRHELDDCPERQPGRGQEHADRGVVHRPNGVLGGGRGGRAWIHRTVRRLDLEHCSVTRFGRRSHLSRLDLLRERNVLRSRWRRLSVGLARRFGTTHPDVGRLYLDHGLESRASPTRPERRVAGSRLLQHQLVHGGGLWPDEFARA